MVKTPKRRTQMTSSLQTQMAHIEAMKPQAEQNQRTLETMDINKMSAAEKADLSHEELIQLRERAQREFFALRQAKKLNYVGFQKG